MQQLPTELMQLLGKSFNIPNWEENENVPAIPPRDNTVATVQKVVPKYRTCQRG
jgi:hypothetical protein